MSKYEMPKYGYVGKILRVNLTTGETSLVDTAKYAPEYIGGRAIAHKIFWDEVEPGTGAFDPGNKMILMTGPTCATGIPTGDRTAMTAISPNNIPEQYCWGSIGGSFPSEMKFAGYDGFIIEGAAESPVQIIIDDDKVEIKPADDLWGMLVHESQEALRDQLGTDFYSLVIGPAGENLVRIASITTGNDSALAKAGFGAVMGSKKLKAISVRGTGKVVPADIAHVLQLRKTMGNPIKKLNPLFFEEQMFKPPYGQVFPIEGGHWATQVCCTRGCNQRCVYLEVDCPSAFPERYEKTNMMNKCIDASYLMKDCGWSPKKAVHTAKSFVYSCAGLSNTMAPPSGDPEPDPDFDPAMNENRIGNNLNLYEWDYERYNKVNGACTELGIDRWDVSVWLIPWLIMAKRTDVISEEEFGGGCLDPLDTQVVVDLLKDMTYSRGVWGKRFHEGFVRALRDLDPKYSETEYEFTSSYVEGLPLKIPISFASAWGHSFHWQGRGFQGSNDIVSWLPVTLKLMINTRDAQTNGHLHMSVDQWHRGFEDPYHNPVLAEIACESERDAEYKESVTTCERMTPVIFWPELESEMFNAATGLDWSKEELEKAAFRSLLLFRAIEIRYHGRTREMEVAEAYPPLAYPDCEGQTSTWEEYNDLVDVFYRYRDWNVETGWPTRKAYEDVDLGYIADEMEALGLLGEPND